MMKDMEEGGNTDIRAFSNPWSSPKDGKGYWLPEDCDPETARKFFTKKGKLRK